MIFERSREQVLDDALFRDPSAEYRGIPFWSWNTRVTRELIDEQLPIFKEMGFGGVDIHPRTGLDTEYLGDEYLELTGYAAQKCEELGLICWLYDDDRFPSGAAGGAVTKDVRFRGRYIVFTQNRQEGYCEDRESFEAAIERGEKPIGYYASAYALELKEGRLVTFRRLDVQQEAVRSSGTNEEVRYAYVRLMDEERWFEGQTYVDTMNPEAIRAFIDSTHEKYAALFGEKLGSRTVPAIFTDEPRMAPRKKNLQLAYGGSGEDVLIPYSESFEARMRQVHDVDIWDELPRYVYEEAYRSANRFRYLYMDTLSESFVTAYMDQIAGWCSEHGIAMTGHVLSEDSLLAQVYALGDCMRCYRGMDIPGVDVLVDDRCFLTIKQASSVARQNGREGTVSELYGVTGWDCDFKTYKLQGDWQAALGINLRVPHLSWMSMEGEAKRDWPASIFFQSPWYREFTYIEEHFARLNTVLTRGRAITRVAMIHPVESAWLCMGAAGSG